MLWRSLSLAVFALDANPDNADKGAFLANHTR
jgi:hypothetical protein